MGHEFKVDELSSGVQDVWCDCLDFQIGDRSIDELTSQELASIEIETLLTCIDRGIKCDKSFKILLNSIHCALDI